MRHRSRTSEKENSLYRADKPCGRMLIALRAGPMDKEQISERFTWEANNIRLLTLGGLVETKGGYYRLTEAGKGVCPSRRGVRI